ncbi:hypothetical protein V1477_014623 [Vespula maculifrons]|uniref:Uncharacterized protein n=1 Tax=Vespula maculifrons TaxID=7453 RepID=A0ABD2BI00_VESMC
MKNWTGKVHHKSFYLHYSDNIFKHSLTLPSITLQTRRYKIYNKIHTNRNDRVTSNFVIMYTLISVYVLRFFLTIKSLFKSFRHVITIKHLFFFIIHFYRIKILSTIFNDLSLQEF